ncbi:Rid family hydrolase [Bradyrhizobium sp. USDA 376]
MDGDTEPFMHCFQCFIWPRAGAALPHPIGLGGESLQTTSTWKCAICRPFHSSIGLIMINRVLPYEGLLHEVVEHNGVLYIGGIVPEDTSLDMSGQANDVLGQLARLLKTLGSDLGNVLQVTIYMTNLKEKAEFNAAWKGAFRGSSFAGAGRNRRGRSRAWRQARDDRHRCPAIAAHQSSLIQTPFVCRYSSRCSVPPSRP